MTMLLLRLIDSNAVAFQPGVRFKLAALFSSADAQLARNSLASEQPPQSERFFQTGGSAPGLANGRINHSRSQLYSLEIACSVNRCCRSSLTSRWKSAMKVSLRSSKTARSQAYGNYRQEYRSAHKHPARFHIHRAKPSKTFPHQQKSLAANHFQPAG